MATAESVKNKTVSSIGQCALGFPADDPRCNQSAEASRFHRFFMAACLILATLLNDPSFLYPPIFSILVLTLTSSRFEPSMLFYRSVLTRILRKNPWPISEEDSGRYLVGYKAEKINCASVGTLILFGLILEACGLKLWIVPIAIAAAGLALAATTGVCLIGMILVQVHKLFPKLL